MNKYIELSKEVKEALDHGKAVVALESTIIAHGMPYPQNLETALEVEKVVRDNGAVPATIAIMDGKLKVGLTKDEIDYLASYDHVLKVSRRDIPFVLEQKKVGATTVASTMIIAEMAGIPLFVTGGIGGVHRGAETTMDISADLDELSNTNVAVVCAGAKAILDLPLTLEYLETKGVPVYGYQTPNLPAFYSRDSGYALDASVDTPYDFAEIMDIKWDLGLKGGVLITNPIPVEYEFPKEEMDTFIELALSEANALNIVGKEVSPFLLAKIKELTKGRSLDSNIALVLNNAKLGAQIAVHYAELKR